MDKVIVFLADGFEEIEALTVVDYLKRACIEVDMVSIKNSLDVCGSHNIIVKADKLIFDINIDDYSALYIPGGLGGAKNLRDDENVIDIIQKFGKDKKIIAAICAGPIVLDKAKVLENRECVSFPSIESELKNIGSYKKDELVVEDDNIITSRAASTSIYLALKLIEKIKGYDEKEKVKSAIEQDFVEEYFDFKF